MPKSIFAHQFGTIELDHIKHTLSYLFFESWRGTKYTHRLTHKLLHYLDPLRQDENYAHKQIMPCFHARSALYHALCFSGIQSGDEVALQAFTCVSVVNAVIAAGGKPLYIDIDPATLNMSPRDLKKKLTKQTKYIIIQHTFGHSAEVEKLCMIAQENGCVSIEDCAHALGSSTNNKKLGNFADMAIFSTGREKVISSIHGGFLLINNPNLVSGPLPALSRPPLGLTLQCIAAVFITFLAKHTYDFCGFGKLIMWICKKTYLLPPIVWEEEKKCNYTQFHWRMPEILAMLAFHQIDKIDAYNLHRQEIAQYYRSEIRSINRELPESHKILLPTLSKSEEVSFHRFAVMFPDAKKFIEYARSRHMYVGDWVGKVIVPASCDLRSCGYTYGLCPEAEQVADTIINLPNHIGVQEEEAERIMLTLRYFIESHVTSE